MPCRLSKEEIVALRVLGGKNMKRTEIAATLVDKPPIQLPIQIRSRKPLRRYGPIPAELPLGLLDKIMVWR